MLSGIFRFNADNSEQVANKSDAVAESATAKQLEEIERQTLLWRTLGQLYSGLRSRFTNSGETIQEAIPHQTLENTDLRINEGQAETKRVKQRFNQVFWLDRMLALQRNVIERTRLEGAIENRQGIIELSEPSNKSLAKLWVEELAQAQQKGQNSVHLTERIQLISIEALTPNKTNPEKIKTWLVGLLDKTTGEQIKMPFTEVTEPITLTPNISQVQNLHIAHNIHYPLIETEYQHNPNRPTLYSNRSSLALTQSQLLEDALIQVAAGNVQNVEEAIRHMQNLAILQDRASVLIRQTEKPYMRNLLESALSATGAALLIKEIRAAKYRPFDRAQRIAREQVMIPLQLPTEQPENKNNVEESDPFALRPIPKIARLTEGPEHKPWFSRTLMAYKERARTKQHSRQAINGFFQAPVVSSADIVKNILQTTEDNSAQGLFHPKIIKAMNQSRSIVIHREHFLGNLPNEQTETNSTIEESKTPANQWRELIKIQNPGINEDLVDEKATATQKLEVTPDDWLNVTSKVSPKLMTTIINDNIQQLKKMGKWRHLPSGVDLLELNKIEAKTELKEILNKLYYEAEMNNRMLALILLTNKAHNRGHYVTIVYQPSQKHWLSLDALNTHLDGVQSVNVFAKKSELIDLLPHIPHIIVPHFLNAV